MVGWLGAICKRLETTFRDDSQSKSVTLTNGCVGGGHRVSQRVFYRCHQAQILIDMRDRRGIEFHCSIGKATTQSNSLKSHGASVSQAGARAIAGALLPVEQGFWI